MARPKPVIAAAEVSGSQRVISTPSPRNRCHEAVCIHHQDANGDQYRGQTNTKGHNKQQPKAYPIQRQGTEEHHKSRGTGDNAAGYTQRQQLTERDC